MATFLLNQLSVIVLLCSPFGDDERMNLITGGCMLSYCSTRTENFVIRMRPDNKDSISAIKHIYHPARRKPHSYQ